jgi:tRNA dimethylallyltransferase
VRIIRALEIVHFTGQKASSFQSSSVSPAKYDTLWLGLTASDSAWLRHRIAQRVHAMMAQGWLDEVRQLLDQYSPEDPGLRISHGYPELIRHLQTGWPLEAALAQTILNSQQYARRQRTWFRRNPNIVWAAVDRWQDEADAQVWIQQRAAQIFSWAAKVS